MNNENDYVGLENKSARQILIDGNRDGIPLDIEAVKDSRIDFSDDSDFDFYKKSVGTDYIYLDICVDFRWLKPFNPKNHEIL